MIFKISKLLAEGNPHIYRYIPNSPKYGIQELHRLSRREFNTPVLKIIMINIFPIELNFVIILFGKSTMPSVFVKYLGSKLRSVPALP